VAVNKNFVVKNGLEVNTRLILADANTNKVGIGSTAPRFELDVAGGIGATDSYVVGVSTVLETFNVGAGGNVLSVIAGAGGISTSKVGIGTSNPDYLLEVRSPVSTGQTALYVYGDLKVTGDLNIDDIVLDDASINNLTVTEAFNVTSPGVSTFSGPVYYTGSVNIAGITTITNTTDSTTYNNGALVIDGGLGVEKSVNIGGDLDVTGNVYIGGTTVTLRGTDVFIENKDIVLGYTTAITPNDDTANHAGVAIASTEGSPLVPFTASGINTLPDTYKQLMWFRSGTLGFSTDMFGFNYGVAVGTTTVADGVRFAVGSDIRFTEDTINTTNLNVSGVGTFASIDINAGDLEVANLDATDINVTGISTLGTVQVSSGIVTATSGIVTYYGDGQYLDLKNSSYTGIGINTSGGLVGYGVTFINFYGAGISTTQYESSVGIATIFFEGGGGGGSISISTTAPLSPSSGDLWYSPDYARTFIYYDENTVGYGTDAQWVDASPFNIGLLTIDDLSVSNLTVTNTFNVLGVSTLTSLDVGNINSSGVSTFSGNINVGSAITVYASTGIVSATSFYGDGSNLSGVSAGSTVFNDTTTDQEFFPLFTETTSGTITASGISTSKLTYNPSSGELTAVDFNSTSDFNLKTNIQTVENALEIVDNLRGVSFEWKENGKKSYGVIAQELEQVLPELVKGDNPKTVSYTGIIGVLIESIKELRSEIKELKNINSTKA